MVEFPKSARLIALEGTEGVGKSTCSQFIEAYLKKSNTPYCMTREPGGTEIAEHIRQVLLQHYTEVMHPDTETLLLFASRAQHLNQVIVPALQQGKWVVTDRYIDSSYAYQGFGRNVGYVRIEQLQQWLSEYVQPNLVFLLEAPVEVALERARRRSCLDRFEQEKNEFFERVQEGYHYRAQKNPANTVKIDAAQSIKLMQEHIVLALEKLKLEECTR